MLAMIAATAFRDTFAADNDPRDMADYLARAFGPELQRAELADPAVTVLLAERDGEVAGYAMLVEGTAAPCVPSANPLEIARLYSAKASIGSGVGAALLRRCLDEAAARGRDSLWLGVWERNRRAIAFYERWGFTDVGSQPFTLGRDVQTDRVMMRRLTEAPR